MAPVLPRGDGRFSFLSRASQPPFLDCRPPDPHLCVTTRAPAVALAEEKREEKKETGRVLASPLLLSFCTEGIVGQVTLTPLDMRKKSWLRHAFALFEKREVDFF